MYAAWCLDEAVYTFGTEVESVVQETMKGVKSKSEAVKLGAGDNALRQMLGMPRKFADPMVGRKAKPATDRDRPFKE